MGLDFVVVVDVVVVVVFYIVVVDFDEEAEDEVDFVGAVFLVLKLFLF